MRQSDQSVVVSGPESGGTPFQKTSSLQKRPFGKVAAERSETKKVDAERGSPISNRGSKRLSFKSEGDDKSDDEDESEAVPIPDEGSSPISPGGSRSPGGSSSGPPRKSCLTRKSMNHCANVFNLFASPAPTMQDPHRRALRACDTGAALASLGLGLEWQHRERNFKRRQTAQGINMKKRRTCDPHSITFKELGIKEFQKVVDQVLSIHDDAETNVESSTIMRARTKLQMPSLDLEDTPRLLRSMRDKKWEKEDNENLLALFRLLGGDGQDNVVMLQELRTAAGALGLDVSNDEIREAGLACDEDLSKGLDFGEFLHWVAKISPPGKRYNEPSDFLSVCQANDWNYSHISEYKAVFSIFDLDGDETIDASELFTVLRCLKLDPTREDVDRMIASADKDGNGSLAFVEFVVVLAREADSSALGGPEDSDDEDDAGVQQNRFTLVSVVKNMGWTGRQILEMKKTFKLFDKDGDETISKRELGAMFRKLGMEIEDEEVDDLLGELDEDGSGTVSFPEFLILLATKMKDPTGSTTPSAADHRKRHSLLSAAFAANEELDEGAHEFEFRQLLIATEGYAAELAVGGGGGLDKASVRRHAVRGSMINKLKHATTGEIDHKSVTEKLLRCIQRVIAQNLKGRTQEKLQEFILDFCTPPPPDPGDPEKPWGRQIERYVQYRKSLGTTLGHTDTAGECTKLLKTPEKMLIKTVRVHGVDMLERETPPSVVAEQLLRTAPAPQVLQSGRKGSGARPTSAPVAGRQTNIKPDYQAGGNRTGGSGQDVRAPMRAFIQTKVGCRSLNAQTAGRACKFSNALQRLREEPHGLDGSQMDAWMPPDWKKAYAEQMQRKIATKAARLAKHTPEIRLGDEAGTADLAALTDGQLDDVGIGAAMKALGVLLSQEDELDKPEAQRDSQPLLVKSVDASGNCFTTHGLEELLGSIKLESVTSLDLSRNADLGGHGSSAALVLAQAMHHNHLARLREFKLDSFRLPRAEQWQVLAQALPDCIYLESVSLSNTHLGKSSGDAQRDCDAVATAVSKMLALKNLDLSGNYFRIAGCKALGAALANTKSLETLSLAGNAGGFLGAGAANTKIHYVPNGPPTMGVPSLRFLIMDLQHNKTLRSIDLASCQLGYEEAFILEISTLAQPKLGRLLLSDNPFGVAGLTCLVRLVVDSPPGQIEYCDLNETRPNKPAKNVYDVTEPRGVFSLSLSRPYDRTVLWRLLLWCEVANVSKKTMLTEAKLTDAKGKTKPIKDWDSAFPIVQGGGDTSMKSFTMPDEGHVNLVSRPATQLNGPGDDSQAVVNNWIMGRRSKVTLRCFVNLSILWRQCKVDDQRMMLTEAIAAICHLKMPQVKYFIKNAPKSLSAWIMETLYPCMDGAERVALMDVVSAPEQRRFVMKRTQHLYYFNPSNPSTHYFLSLQNPTDMAVAERLLVLNKWHKFMCEKLNMADTTQMGDGHHFRNTKLNGQRFVFDESWILPQKGSEVTFSLDYAVPLRPDEKASITSARVLDSFIHVLESSLAHCYDKVLMVRILSHNLYLNPNQLLHLVESFPRDDRDLSTSDKLYAGAEDLNEPRVEVFVTLFCRCADRITVCSPEVLYNVRFMPRQQVYRLWSRLGRLNLFDMKHICQQVSSNTSNKYDLYLTQYEDWRIMGLLVKMVAYEEDAHLKKCWYSEVSYLSAGGDKASGDGKWELAYDYLVPATWIQEVPKVGQIKFTYTTAGPGRKQVAAEKRMALAEQYLNWFNCCPAEIVGQQLTSTNS